MSFDHEDIAFDRARDGVLDDPYAVGRDVRVRTVSHRSRRCQAVSRDGWRCDLDTGHWGHHLDDELGETWMIERRT